MLHVVTAAHNRYAITEKFVNSLNAQTVQPIHLILIDDGSTDGTADMVMKKMPNATILTGDGNRWWGGALHMAYKWLLKNSVDDNDIVMISNDDTTYDSDYIEKAVRHMEENPDTLIAGCAYGMRSEEHMDGIFEHNFIDGTGHLMPPDSESNCASTRSLFLRVKDWKRIGGMHPVLLPHYLSDFEFTIRGYRKGLKIKCFGDLRFEFDEGATGINEYSKLTLKKMFSKRSGCNPFYRLSFILLSTPPKYLPAHIGHQIGRYVKKFGVFKEIAKKK